MSCLNRTTGGCCQVYVPYCSYFQAQCQFCEPHSIGSGCAIWNGQCIFRYGCSAKKLQQSRGSNLFERKSFSKRVAEEKAKDQLKNKKNKKERRKRELDIMFNALENFCDPKKCKNERDLSCGKCTKPATQMNESNSKTLLNTSQSDSSSDKTNLTTKKGNKDKASAGTRSRSRLRKNHKNGESRAMVRKTSENSLEAKKQSSKISRGQDIKNREVTEDTNDGRHFTELEMCDIFTNLLVQKFKAFEFAHQMIEPKTFSNENSKCCSQCSCDNCSCLGSTGLPDVMSKIGTASGALIKEGLSKSKTSTRKKLRNSKDTLPLGSSPMSQINTPRRYKLSVEEKLFVDASTSTARQKEISNSPLESLLSQLYGEIENEGEVAGVTDQNKFYSRSEGDASDSSVKKSRNTKDNIVSSTGNKDRHDSFHSKHSFIESEEEIHSIILSDDHKYADRNSALYAKKSKAVAQMPTHDVAKMSSHSLLNMSSDRLAEIAKSIKEKIRESTLPEEISKSLEELPLHRVVRISSQGLGNITAENLAQIDAHEKESIKRSTSHSLPGDVHKPSTSDIRTLKRTSDNEDTISFPNRSPNNLNSPKSRTSVSKETEETAFNDTKNALQSCKSCQTSCTDLNHLLRNDSHAAHHVDEHGPIDRGTNHRTSLPKKIVESSSSAEELPAKRIRKRSLQRLSSARSTERSPSVVNIYQTSDSSLERENCNEEVCYRKIRPDKIKSKSLNEGSTEREEKSNESHGSYPKELSEKHRQSKRSTTSSIAARTSNANVRPKNYAETDKTFDKKETIRASDRNASHIPIKIPTKSHTKHSKCGCPCRKLVQSRNHASVLELDKETSTRSSHGQSMHSIRDSDRHERAQSDVFDEKISTPHDEHSRYNHFDRETSIRSIDRQTSTQDFDRKSSHVSVHGQSKHSICGCDRQCYNVFDRKQSIRSFDRRPSTQDFNRKSSQFSVHRQSKHSTCGSDRQCYNDCDRKQSIRSFNQQPLTQDFDRKPSLISSHPHSKQSIRDSDSQETVESYASDEEMTSLHDDHSPNSCCDRETFTHSFDRKHSSHHQPSKCHCARQEPARSYTSASATKPFVRRICIGRMERKKKFDSSNIDEEDTMFERCICDIYPTQYHPCHVTGGRCTCNDSPKLSSRPCEEGISEGKQGTHASHTQNYPHLTEHSMQQQFFAPFDSSPRQSKSESCACCSHRAPDTSKEQTHSFLTMNGCQCNYKAQFGKYGESIRCDFKPNPNAFPEVHRDSGNSRITYDNAEIVERVKAPVATCCQRRECGHSSPGSFPQYQKYFNNSNLNDETLTRKQENHEALRGPCCQCEILQAKDGSSNEIITKPDANSGPCCACGKIQTSKLEKHKQPSNKSLSSSSEKEHGKSHSKTKKRKSKKKNK